MPLGDQCWHLASVILGHCACYGLTGSGKQLSRIRIAVVRSWRFWLGRRHRNGWIIWERFNANLGRFPLSPAQSHATNLRSPEEAAMRGAGWSNAGTSGSVEGGVR